MRENLTFAVAMLGLILAAVLLLSELVEQRSGIVVYLTERVEENPRPRLAVQAAERSAQSCVELGRAPSFQDYDQYLAWYAQFFETKVPWHLQRSPATGAYAPGVYLVIGTLGPVRGGTLQKVSPISAVGNPTNVITGMAWWVVTEPEGVLTGGGGRSFRVCQ